MKKVEKYFIVLILVLILSCLAVALDDNASINQDNSTVVVIPKILPDNSTIEQSTELLNSSLEIYPSKNVLIRLFLDNDSFALGDDINLEAQINYDDDTPVINAESVLYIDGIVNSTYVTDDYGMVSFSMINLSVGYHIIKIVYGDASDFRFITITDKNIINNDNLLKVKIQANKNKNKLNNITKIYIDKVIDENENREFIVKFSGKIKENKLVNFSIKKEFLKLNIIKIKGKVVDLSELLGDSSIEYIELEQKTKVLSDNIPYGVIDTRAPEVWINTTGQRIKIAVLDTGISNHDDLQIAGGVSIVSDSYIDYNGHGTSVAGVLSAKLNDYGLAGVAPDAEIYAVKIMNDSNGNLSDAIFGIEWSIDNNMNIISMSFGIESYSQILKETIQEAYDNGILLVAAAGNDNGEILYPASYSDVIAVGALNENKMKASFSNYGTKLELMAAGVNINSTGLNNNYVVNSGTSLAAPHVAGIVALIWDYNNSLSNIQVRAKLRNDAIDLGSLGKDDYYGYGLAQVNLSSDNYTIVDDSYFYEIFNYTNVENRTLTFWLNGTGFIDDLNFSEGYYLIKKYNSFNSTQQIIFVNETGQINSLYPKNLWLDNYNSEGTTVDGVLWVDGTLQFKYNNTNNTLYGLTDTVCYDDDYDGTFSFWKCWSLDWSALAVCESHFPELKTFCHDQHSPMCINNSFSSWYNINSNRLSSIHYYILKIKAYYDCGNGVPSEYNPISSGWEYYIIDRKKTQCGGNGFDILGGYGTYSWINYDNANCNSIRSNSICDSAIAGNYEATSSSYNFKTVANSPCKISDGYSCSSANDCLTGHYCILGTCSAVNRPICNGTIQVNTLDYSGITINSLSVYVNNSFNSSTSNFGQSNIKISNVFCGADYEIKVKCSDNSTLCGLQTTSISTNGDFDSLNFDCTQCSSKKDLYATQNDIFINTTNKNVKVTVHSIGINSSVVVVLYGQDSDGILKEFPLSIISVTSGSAVNASFNLTTLNPTDYIHVYIDSNNSVKNEDETNNYLFRAVNKRIKAKLVIGLEPQYNIIGESIKEYIGSFVDLVDTNEDMTITVGNPMFTQKANFSFYENHFKTSNGPITKPYAGVVRKDMNLNMRSISVFGKDIEGTIAAVKRMVNARNIFFESYSTTNNFIFYESYIDDYDTLGISVFDLMHNSENNMYYKKNNTQFKNVVSSILFDNNFEVAVNPVLTLNTTSYGNSTYLRVKHVNSDYSSNYKDALSISDKPVVFSGGIFSNLETWEESNGLAKQMSQEGWDVWEIEMTGGPYTDCAKFDVDTCPNYNYDDLVDYYWPASIAGIMSYSGKDQIDYVGHSNGGRVALSSLNKYSQSGKDNAGFYLDYNTGTYQYADLPIQPVDKFVGVAVPAVLNDESRLTKKARDSGIGDMTGDEAIFKLNQSRMIHLNMYNYAFKIDPIPTGLMYVYNLGKSNKISLNLMDYYNDLAMKNDSVFNVSSVNLNSIYLIGGTDLPYLKIGKNNSEDGAVPVNDVYYIYNLISLTNKSISLFEEDHSSIVTSERTSQYIKMVIT